MISGSNKYICNCNVSNMSVKMRAETEIKPVSELMFVQYVQHFTDIFHRNLTSTILIMKNNSRDTISSYSRC